LANHHRVINYSGNQGEEKAIGTQRFAGILSYQLLKNAKQLGSSNCSAPTYLPEIVQLPGKSVVSSDLSTPTEINDKPIVRSMQDANGKTHYLVKYDKTRDPSGRCRTIKRNARSVWSRIKGKMLVSFV